MKLPHPMLVFRIEARFKGEAKVLFVPELILKPSLIDNIDHFIFNALEVLL